MKNKEKRQKNQSFSPLSAVRRQISTKRAMVKKEVPTIFCTTQTSLDLISSFPNVGN